MGHHLVYILYIYIYVYLVYLVKTWSNSFFFSVLGLILYAVKKWNSESKLGMVDQTGDGCLIGKNIGLTNKNHLETNGMC